MKTTKMTAQKGYIQRKRYPAVPGQIILDKFTFKKQSVQLWMMKLKWELITVNCEPIV
jgi:hypothetical protein